MPPSGNSSASIGTYAAPDMSAFEEQLAGTFGSLRGQMFVDASQERPENAPNLHHEGEELLVKSFDYGTGFEIVDEAVDMGPEIKYYRVVVIQQIYPKKKKKIDYYSLPRNFGMMSAPSIDNTIEQLVSSD